MTFVETLEQVRDLLQSKGRISYRALKRQFALDDDYVEDLKAELIDAERVASDEDGKVLVWVGNAEEDKEKRITDKGRNAGREGETDSQPRTPNSELSPASYTPRHLAERILAEREAMEARGTADGERKTITALFADLKGSTALIDDLDPEEARSLIDPALQLMMDAVHRYEGYVAQSLGDGIFALFGAPIAHEDHPHRALYAALLMQDDMRRYSETLRTKGYPPLLMRVGVNTGEVVVRSIHTDDLHTDYVPVGQSTNIAARLEQLATPGAIVISSHTHKLVEGYFECKALGTTPIKGVSEPLHLYEVSGIGPLRTKMQVAARHGLARFVGRQSEMEQVQRALDQTKAGHGQIVGVMGEPGVGKSRLFYEFKLLSQRGCLILETFSVSHGKAYPYLPLIDLLKNYFQLGLHDDERQRREKVTGRVLTLDRSLEDTLPYLFFLLGIVEPTSPLQQMDPQIRRKRILEAIKRLLIRESLNQPLIVIFEDLHWLDAETQAFLQVLSESIPTARVLLLVNYRPEYQHTWGGKTYFSQLRLDPLGREQAEEMLTALLGNVGTQHAVSLRRFILEKTEGNPFFIEEIVQTLREQGLLTVGATGHTPLLTDLRLPATVQGVLTSRIDRLPPEEKSLLQTLAVIGKKFSLSLLKPVADQPEDNLLRQLSRLRTSEFIYERPAFPDIEYIFKHALTQEVAYNSLLIERRKVVHERAAKAIEKIYRYKLDDRYSELAHHYSRSGNTQKAIDYLQLAGQQAAQRSAYTEAVNHFTAALELLKTLPDTPKRIQQELTLQLALGPALGHSKGYTIPEVEQIYTRARELTQHIGEVSQLFPIVLGLRTFYHLRGQLQTARQLGEQLLELAQKVQHQAFLMLAHRALGSTLFALGKFALARTHLEQSIALYDSPQHRYDDVLYGQSPAVLGRGYLAWTLWSLGYPTQALEKIHETFTWTQDLSRPANLGTALANAITLHVYRREERAVQEKAEALITLCTEQGTPNFLSSGLIGRGWALAEQGQKEEGIAQIRQGLALGNDVAGAWSLHRPFLLALLADNYGRIGNAEEGLKTLSEALAIVDNTGERHDEAELYRLKGELLLQQFKVQGSTFNIENPQSVSPNPQLESEECFRQAIAIARKQQAKSLELRAVMSLVRLRLQQATREESRITDHVPRATQHEAHSKLAEAHRMLSEVYNWFTEGFGTKDLQEAKALLESLSSRV